MTMRVESFARLFGVILLAGALALGTAGPAAANSIGLDGLHEHEQDGDGEGHHEGGSGGTGPTLLVEQPRVTVPEPATLVLMGAGLAGAGLLLARRRRVGA